MLSIPRLDHYVLLYLNYISTIFLNISNTGVPDLQKFAVNVTTLGYESSCNGSTKLKCELVSKTLCRNAGDLLPSLEGLEFVWYFNESLTKNSTIAKQGIGPDFQLMEIDMNMSRHEKICCEIFVPPQIQNHSFGQNCVSLFEKNMTESPPTPPEMPIPLVPHIHLHAGLIQCRSAIIMWKSFDNLTQSKEENSEMHFLEYKLSKLDWKFATKIKITSSQNVILVEGLLPWSMYHFRMTTTFKSGASLPSSPILVVTPEDFPSGPVEHVSVSIVDDHTLLVKWKPPPRSTWNGALLGYNIGYKKLTSKHETDDSDEDESDESGSEDSFSFIVLTSVELVGKLCEHQISVPDSKTLTYAVVVQPFNNVGRGPLSIPVSTSN